MVIVHIHFLSIVPLLEMIGNDIRYRWDTVHVRAHPVILCVPRTESNRSDYPEQAPLTMHSPPTPPSNVGRGKLAAHGNFSCDMQIRLKPLNERSTLLGERGR